MLGGPGACSPDFFVVDKNGATWRNLGVPRYVITNIRIINQQIKLAYFSLRSVCTKINTFSI